jgi:hypothetical protein
MDFSFLINVVFAHLQICHRSYNSIKFGNTKTQEETITKYRISKSVTFEVYFTVLKKGIHMKAFFLFDVPLIKQIPFDAVENSAYFALCTSVLHLDLDICLRKIVHFALFCLLHYTKSILYSKKSNKKHIIRFSIQFCTFCAIRLGIASVFKFANFFMFCACFFSRTDKNTCF